MEDFFDRTHEDVDDRTPTCIHGTKTWETVIDPYFEDLYGKQVEMIACDECFRESMNDI